MKGYIGKILYFNLSQSEKEIRDLDTDDAKKYIGGSGLGAKILFDETDEHTDPLGPENVLIFMTGPFTGTPVLSSSRYTHLTGMIIFPLKPFENKDTSYTMPCASK